MKVYSIDVDSSNPTALGHCLTKLEHELPEFEWEWKLTVNAGGIDYGIYLNINVDKKEIEISNEPTEEEDMDLDDIIDMFYDDEDDE